jgi:hypothetical protein
VVYDWWVIRELDRHGVAASAVVVDRRVEHGDVTTYRLDYKLTIADHVPLEHERVSEEVYQDHPTGSAIDIRYSSRDHSLVRMKSNDRPWFGTVVAVLLELSSHAVIVAVMASLTKAIRLERDGVLVIGTTLSCRAERDSEGAYHVTLDYEVRTPLGWVVTGTDSARRDDLASATLPSPGAPVAVVVLDEHCHAAL